MPRKTFFKDVFEKIKEIYLSDSRGLIILRGLPGSGKTHLTELVNSKCNGKSEVICHMDILFDERNNFIEYQHDPNLVKMLFEKCFQKFQDSSAKLIFIDNGNQDYEAFERYIDYAIAKNNFKIIVVEIECPQRYIELARRRSTRRPIEKKFLLPSSKSVQSLAKDWKDQVIPNQLESKIEHLKIDAQFNEDDKWMYDNHHALI